MSPAQITQLITAVTVAPVALIIGLLVTYFVANIEQIKHRLKTRRTRK